MGKVKKKTKHKSSSRKLSEVADSTAGSLPRFHRKKRFKNFKDLAEYSKKAVYLIVRLRSLEDGDYYRPLGTGFLAGKGRLITCHHCINSDADQTPMAQHVDGDLYLLIQKDEDGNYHRYGITNVNVNEQLFLYPDLDLAVFELPDDFYFVDGEYYKHPELYLELSPNHFNIGTETVILGYPLPDLSFDENGLPDLTNVHIRGDQGVVNTRYIKAGIEAYEFTTPFNPGNSGGPILNLETGEVIGMVFAYNSIPINFMEDFIPKGVCNNEEDIAQISVLRTTYSIGVSSRNYQTIIENHSLAIRSS